LYRQLRCLVAYRRPRQNKKVFDNPALPAWGYFVIHATDCFESLPRNSGLAVQNFSFAQRVEDGYFIGEISFDVYCYGSE
jgi:hypothetical protein